MKIDERNKLIEENINLVYYVVNRYFNKFGDYEEFIGEGFVGLIKAADSFENSKKLKFSTYACNCIHNEICRYLNVQNYNCRKANIGASSIEEKIYDNSELTFKDLLECNEDYSIAYVNNLLEIIDGLNYKNAKFICLKRMEGYGWREIGKMLGVSGECVRQTVVGVRHKLIRLGITA